jgi:hypothetical protein
MATTAPAQGGSIPTGNMAATANGKFTPSQVPTVTFGKLNGPPARKK